MSSDILNQSVGILLPAFLVASMLSLGLGLTIQQIVQPLRDTRLVARSLVVSILVVPLVAIAITAVIPLDPALGIGFVLFACVAGVEAGPKFVQIAGGNASFAFGLLIAQLIVTITVVPVLLGLIAPGADIPRGMLLLKLLLIIALPVAVGGFIHARCAKVAERLKPMVHRMSMLLLCAVLVTVVIVNFAAIRSMPVNALVAGALFFLIALALGYAYGGPATQHRRTLAVMSFGRSGGIGIMLAAQAFAEDPDVILMTTLMTVASVVVAVLFVAGLRRIDALAGQRDLVVHQFEEVVQ
jgi:BASS family bile acid:Na+ symporter